MTTPPYIPLETPFSLIACQQAFNSLDLKQSLYAFNFAKASWNGALVCFFQRSYESPALLYIVLKALEGLDVATLVNKTDPTISKQDISKILVYTAAFLENAGNFKSFGDSKFIPECSKQTFTQFWRNTPYWSQHHQLFDVIWNKISKYIFEYEKPYGLIQFSDNDGTTGYYNKSCTSKDAEKVKKILIENGIMSENNRLVKVSDNHFIVKIAAIDQKQKVISSEDVKITLEYGQFSPFLSRVNKYLAQAKKYSANEIQQRMIDEYIEHFRSGDMQRHKQSQRYWIKDKQPDIQTNIGFIESYLDPLRVRAEFEGFVSIVNKKESKLLTKLVDAADHLLKYLPWGSNFEVEEFKKPDFTSLEILAFASSGVPVGINIPNYDDIRQNLGFKNVNLGNAYGQPTQKTIQYTPVDEIKMHLRWYEPSLFVVVALHELLGHGSGKLFRKKPNLQSPLDQHEITTFYSENETWHSVFGQVASTYEECRADSVALYLSVFEDVQEILLPDLTPEQRWEVVYVAWFDLIVGGLKGLIYYDVPSKKWLQAHIGASFAIFRVLRKQGGVFEVVQTQRNGKPYLEIRLNRQSIKTKGKKAIGEFLKHLQVYKSSADFQRGSEYFNQFLEVDEQLLKYKQIVEKNKRPRRLSIQPYLSLQNGKPVYKKFEATAEDCVNSFASQYQEHPEQIIEEWNRNNQQFRY